MWTPQVGPQADAISATWCDELFYGGAKGGGKSDFLLGDFLQDVHKYAAAWRGVIFRKSYPELEELLIRAEQLFKPTGASYHKQDKEWRWPNGASLRFRYIESLSDCQNYQGHQYAWIGLDELPLWADAMKIFGILKTCLRSAANVPTKRIRASGNPGGAGHQAVKSYFIDHAPEGYKPFDIVDEESGLKTTRLFIPAKVRDNKILLKNDPTYIMRLKQAGSPELVRVWLDGDWNTIAGAYFSEFGSKHVILPFKIPEHWLRFSAYDWGSSRPFCHLWFAVSDGTMGIPKNALVVYREFYGSTGVPNEGLKATTEWEISELLKREAKDEIIKYRVADPSIFDASKGESIAEKFSNKKIYFSKAENSRITGWNQIRSRFVGDEGKPMLYVFSVCKNLIRTIPLQQHDERNIEDLDTDIEDHALDTLRYGCMSRMWTQEAPAKPEPIRGIENMKFKELIKDNLTRNDKPKYGF